MGRPSATHSLPLLQLPTTSINRMGGEARMYIESPGTRIKTFMYKAPLSVAEIYYTDPTIATPLVKPERVEGTPTPASATLFFFLHVPSLFLKAEALLPSPSSRRRVDGSPAGTNAPLRLPRYIATRWKAKGEVRNEKRFASERPRPRAAARSRPHGSGLRHEVRRPSARARPPAPFPLPRH